MKDWDMIHAMEKYGGSFVKALSACFTHADRENYQKLERAFAVYCMDYRAMVRENKNKRDE